MCEVPWSRAYYPVELKLRPVSVYLLERSIIVFMGHTLLVLKSDNLHELVCGNRQREEDCISRVSGVFCNVQTHNYFLQAK